MVVKLKGVILKISETLHSDRLLFLLTEDRGRIQVFDNHYKSGGKKYSTLDLFTYCEFVLYESNGKYTLNSATVLETFFKLRENIHAAALAGYFSQISLFATQDSNVIHPELPSLLLNSLYLLSRKPEQTDKIKAVFEWKIIQYLGFTPSLQCCEHISFDGEVYFSVEDGGLYCKTCVPTQKRAPAFLVQASVVKAIGFILESPPNKAFSFAVSAASMQQIGSISEEYLQYQCGQDFSALNMYKVLG